MFIGGILNTSAKLMHCFEDLELNRNNKCVAEHIITITDLDTLNAQELDDDSNKLRLVRRLLLSDINSFTDLKVISCCSKVGFTSFILFESDNSPPHQF
jgi:hypothetical protein